MNLILRLIAVFFFVILIQKNLKAQENESLRTARFEITLEGEKRLFKKKKKKIVIEIYNAFDLQKTSYFARPVEIQWVYIETYDNVDKKGEPLYKEIIRTQFNIGREFYDEREYGKGIRSFSANRPMHYSWDKNIDSFERVDTEGRTYTILYDSNKNQYDFSTLFSGEIIDYNELTDFNGNPYKRFSAITDNWYKEIFAEGDSYKIAVHDYDEDVKFDPLLINIGSFEDSVLTASYEYKYDLKRNISIYESENNEINLWEPEDTSKTKPIFSNPFMTKDNSRYFEESNLHALKLFNPNLNKIEIYLKNEENNMVVEKHAYSILLEGEPLLKETITTKLIVEQGHFETVAQLKGMFNDGITKAGVVNDLKWSELTFKAKYILEDLNLNRLKSFYGQDIPEFNSPLFTLQVIESTAKELLLGNEFLFQDPSGNSSILSFSKDSVTETSGKFSKALKVGYYGRGYTIFGDNLGRYSFNGQQSFVIMKDNADKYYLTKRIYKTYDTFEVFGDLKKIDDSQNITTDGKEVFVHVDLSVYPFTIKRLDIANLNTSGLWTGLINSIFWGDFDKISAEQHAWLPWVHNIFIRRQGDYYIDSLPSNFIKREYNYDLTRTSSNAYGVVTNSSTNTEVLEIYMDPKNLEMFNSFLDADHFSRGFPASPQRHIRSNIGELFLLSDKHSKLYSFDGRIISHFRENLYRYCNSLEPILWGDL